MTDRQQYRIVNQYKSKSRDVICGIPQGSTLGPLLFNIYINNYNLPLASNSRIHLFANDTNLTFYHSNLSTQQQNINDELVNVSNWFKLNKLSINFNQTEFMVLTTKQNKPELKVSIDNNPIKQSHHMKYLDQRWKSVGSTGTGRVDRPVRLPVGSRFFDRPVKPIEKPVEFSFLATKRHLSTNRNVLIYFIMNKTFHKKSVLTNHTFRKHLLNGFKLWLICYDH